MSEIEDMAMKIFHAYEDFCLDKEKCKIFEELFDRFLTPIDKDGKSEPYDVIVQLGFLHPAEFDQMVKILKDHSLIQD
jgi:hypothetical protein